VDEDWRSSPDDDLELDNIATSPKDADVAASPKDTDEDENE
jgi:hypothetical protein